MLRIFCLRPMNGEVLMLSETDRRRVDEAINYFLENRSQFDAFAQSLMLYFESNKELAKYIYFIKYRIKDVDSLREKLERVLTSSSEEDLVSRIKDFAGVRIIHLHMDQFSFIHPLVSAILNERNCKLLEIPKAYCWDMEYESLFTRVGVEAVQRSSMYTTVHYDILANQRKRITCELQVRSLPDELWGEVSHRINYPKESQSESCQDQLKVLARLTSGCGRLVDSIFKSHHATIE